MFHLGLVQNSLRLVIILDVFGNMRPRPWWRSFPLLPSQVWTFAQTDYPWKWILCALVMGLVFLSRGFGIIILGSGIVGTPPEVVSWSVEMTWSSSTLEISSVQWKYLPRWLGMLKRKDSMEVGFLNDPYRPMRCPRKPMFQTQKS